MIKRVILAIVVTFVVWSALNFVLHNVILAKMYEDTAEFWRPMEEMKMPLMQLMPFVQMLCFTGIYAMLAEKKSLAAGVKYGVLFGLAVGVPMGFGTYSYMPIPLMIDVIGLRKSWTTILLSSRRMVSRRRSSVLSRQTTSQPTGCPSSSITGEPVSSM